MASRSMDARAERSREGLRQALLELIVEKPLEQIAIREIATRAKVSFPTFYRQYATRDALLDDIAAQEIRDLLDIAMTVAGDGDAAGAGTAICDFVLSHRTLWHALLTSGATAAMREEFVRRARDMARSRNFEHPDFPIDLMAPFVVAGIFEILSWWLRQADDVPKDHVARLLEVLVVEPSYGYKDVSLSRPRP